MDDRNYSSNDLKRIIEIALKLQSREQGGTRGEGQSFQDVVAVGREIGLSDELIRRAADELETRRSRGAAAKVFGGPLLTEERLTLPHEVEKERIEELSAELSRLTGLPGQSSMVGRRLTWQSSYWVSQQRAWTLGVSVGASGGRTTIEAESRSGTLAGALFGGTVGGVGVGAGVGVGVGVGVGALGSAAFAVIVPVATIAATFLLCRSLFSLITRARSAKTRRLVERIADVLADSEPTGVDANSR